MLTRPMVEEYFARLDLVVVREGDDWKGTFPGANRIFQFRAALAGPWLELTASLALDGKAAPNALYIRMLRLNAEMRLARLAIDPAGDVIVRVDLPTADLDFSEFKEALDAVRRYAGEHEPELRKLAG